MTKNCTWITHGTYPFKKPQVSVLYFLWRFSCQHFRRVTPLQCFPWSQLRVQLTSPLHENSLRFWTKKLGSPKSLKAAMLHALKSFWRWTSWTSSQNTIEARMQNRGLILFDCLLLPCTSGGESSKADLATFVVEIGITLDTKTFRLCT